MTDATTTTGEQLIDHTFTEEGGPLPVSLYSTTLTRERVQRMDPDTQAQALGAWQAARFPPARDAAGNSVHLTGEQLRGISNLLRSFERTIDDIDVVRAVTDRLEQLSSGERWVVTDVARGHGIENITALLFTDGEVYLLGRIIDRVVDLRDEQPTPAADLEPLPDPGRVVTTPVDEPAELELELVPPDGKVADVLDWVGDDPQRAAKALEAERAGKARKTLVGKLELLVDHGDAPAPAGEQPTPDSGGGSDDGDPFAGANGEPPSSSSDGDGEGGAEGRVVDLMGALTDSVERARSDRKAAGVKVPDVPPPSVTRAGGRLTPDDALEHIDRVVGDLHDAVVALEQLADRIRKENTP